MKRSIKYWSLLTAAGLVICSILLLSRREPSLLQRPENEQQIKDFFTAKEAQARQLVSMEKTELPPEIWPYFAAGKKGDWATVTNLYAKMASRCYHFDGNKDYDERMQTMAWQPINETDRFYLQCTQPDSKHALAFGQEIMHFVPPGSILFGDNDPARFIPTALCRDHTKGEPFFVLTQNALVDSLYLEYLRTMFGTKLHIPTNDDSKSAFDDYVTDALQRLNSGRLEPVENVQKEGHQVSVSGQVSVARIAGLVSKTLFDKNPTREFYVSEGFPSDWIYPRAEPHGPIIRVNHQRLTTLPVEAFKRDRNYWNKRVIPFLGDWMKEETSIEEICTFVMKVYILKDYRDFKGDRDYVSMATFQQTLPAYSPAAKTWSQARSAIAGVYVWRINDCSRQLRDIQNLPVSRQKEKTAEIIKLQQEQQAYLKEADYAYRQAIVLNPADPVAVYRYTSLLTSLNRFDDALRIVKVAKLLHPEAFAPLEKELMKEDSAKQNGVPPR